MFFLFEMYLGKGSSGISMYTWYFIAKSLNSIEFFSWLRARAVRH